MIIDAFLPFSHKVSFKDKSGEGSAVARSFFTCLFQKKSIFSLSGQPLACQS